MSSKIEVSLTDRLEDIAQDLTFMKDRNTIREAIALLAAPVVERQYYYRVDACKVRDSKDPACICWHNEGTGPLFNNPWTQTEPKTWRDKPTPTAQPELAELQATIANLTTELKVTKQALESLKGERDELHSEIERLKGGQGEPVAFPGYSPVPDDRKIEPPASGCKTCGGTRLVDDDELTCSAGGIPYENGPIKLVKDCPDCASQPTPVAVGAWRKTLHRFHFISRDIDYMRKNYGDCADFALIELSGDVAELEATYVPTPQPAPVSAELVQLLERAKVYARGPFLDEINACLEKHTGSESLAEPWNGEGLPPIGEVCEYLFQPGHILGEEIGEYFVRDREWVKAEVLLHHHYDGKRFAIIHAPGHGFRGCSDTTGEMFRPVQCLDKVKELNQ